jgi:sulfatase modifying factor 1
MRIERAWLWLPLLVCGCTHNFSVFELSAGDDGSPGPDATRSDAGSDATTKKEKDSGSDGRSAETGPGDSSSDDGSDSGPPECVISGTMYASGDMNPSTVCQTCQPSVTPSDWSNLTDGTNCGSDGGGGVCHTGACVSGCEIGGVYYMATAANPNNPCQSCQPGVSASAWSSLADSTSCGNGQVCSSGQCGTQCDIAGVIVASGAANPSSACQSCQPGIMTTAWTNAAVGTSCGSGEVCNAGTCAAGCYIGGPFYATAATANDGCEVCTPTTSTTAWTNVTGAASCPSGEVCNAGSCASGCSVGGTYYASASTTNDGCEVCTPGTSTTTWTIVTGAAACPSGEVCNGGTCASGCSIGGTYYASAATANNGCEVCTPGASTKAWTDVTGKSCNGSGTCSTGSCVMPASCSAGGSGMTNCGAGGSGSESCCTSLEVAGGTFYRTYDADDAGTGSGEAGTGQANPATVSGFRLDKYLVTVGRFRKFVAAWNAGAGYLPAAGSGKHSSLNGGNGLGNSGDPGTYETGWDATNWNNTTDVDPTNTNLACGGTSDTWSNTAGTHENLPINCVNWWEAYAFCIWDGGYLPTEAEWEYAAAGGSLQRAYPWGTVAPGTANQYAIYSGNYTGNATDIAPVGYASLGAGNWGQFDLAGEVWEWNLDWYATYAACTDCAYLTATSERVMRGDDFTSTVVTNLLPPTRDKYAPTYRAHSIGFRCARSP